MCSCKTCGNTIQEERVDVWLIIHGCPPTYCMDCADDHTPKSQAFMSYGHKTGGEVVVATGGENIRRAERDYLRAR